MLDRRVVKIERMADTPMSNNEYLYRVWYEIGREVKWDYVWAKDELQAYQRVKKANEAKAEV